MDTLLEVKDLQISFNLHGRKIQAVRGVNFDLSPGETIAIVGESGCGKSATVQGIMGLINSPQGRIESGQVWFQGSDLTLLSGKEMERIRGREISMIFQDPMTSLNPTMPIGKQITEGLLLFRKLSKGEAREKAIEMLNLVGVNLPERRIKQYPHEFSGGMRQRIMIAMALICQPKILIADEPTTALDVTIQAQIMELLEKIKEEIGTSIILITHDLALVAGTASRVLVMYGGKIVEAGSVREIFYDACHPYTQGLLKSIPRVDKIQNQRLKTIPGQHLDLFNPPPGCTFAPRCTDAMDICRQLEPRFKETGINRGRTCWLANIRESIPGKEGDDVSKISSSY